MEIDYTKRLTSEQLRVIAEYCDVLAPVWDAVFSGGDAGLTVGGEVSLSVFAGKERVGNITWSEDGFGFFPVTSPEVVD